MTNPWGSIASSLIWAKIRPWLWVAGGVAVLALLLLHRSWVADVKRETREEVSREYYDAAQAQAEAWAKQLDDANKAIGRAHGRARTAAEKASRDVENEYAGNPGAGDRVLVDDDLVRRAQSDRNRIRAAGRNGSSEG